MRYRITEIHPNDAYHPEHPDFRAFDKTPWAVGAVFDEWEPFDETEAGFRGGVAHLANGVAVVLYAVKVEEVAP